MFYGGRLGALGSFRAYGLVSGLRTESSSRGVELRSTGGLGVSDGLQE